MSSKQPYSGKSRKLVLAFDVGTTFSGVSYAILDPGSVPKVSPVTRYPSNENAGGDSKIPTIIYYDRNGAVKAVGAEAKRDDINEQAQDEGWTKAEWFKLHLRPKSISAEHVRDSSIPPLPPQKTVVDVFADFLRYLFECAQSFIQDNQPNGTSLWRSFEKEIEFVLTHPNGWEGQQQSQMRRAAVQAGLVPEGEESHNRLQFVTEGEASLHFCVAKLSSESAPLQIGQGIIVVDAGGGTIDLSAYRMQEKESFEEIAPTECRLQGSLFVSRRAREYLGDHLRGSRYGTKEEMDEMAEIFDKTTKTTFRDENDMSFIKFGSVSTVDPRVNIRHGQLKIPGTIVARFFEPSLEAIVEAIKRQKGAADNRISAVFLVGGFGANNWLFSRLKTSLQALGLSLSRPDSHVNKAVSDGAILFHLNNIVKARVAKWSYGTDSATGFDPSDPDHKCRMKNIGFSLGGQVLIDGKWNVMLRKVTSDQEFEEVFQRVVRSRDALSSITTRVQSYVGSIDPCPEWIDVDPRNFKTLCLVVADTKEMAKSVRPSYGPNGIYFRQAFKLVLLFGLSELKAQIRWMENGVERRGPATVVYDIDELEDPANDLADEAQESEPEEIEDSLIAAMIMANLRAQHSKPRPSFSFGSTPADGSDSQDTQDNQAASASDFHDDPEFPLVGQASRANQNKGRQAHKKKAKRGEQLFSNSLQRRKF